MVVQFHVVPTHERHLLFSSDPRLAARSSAPMEDGQLEAINRVLAVHGEAVDELIPIKLAVGFGTASPVIGVA